MDYMNLKQGDVIVIHWKNERIIAIFDKYMYGYNSIRICCDLHEYHREDGYLCTEAERLHSFEFGLDNITYRKASEGEKNRIYNAIGKNLLSMMKIGINISPIVHILIFKIIFLIYFVLMLKNMMMI